MSTLMKLTFNDLGDAMGFWNDVESGGITIGGPRYLRMHIRDEVVKTYGHPLVLAVADNIPANPQVMLDDEDQPCFLSRALAPAP